jgi:hypothetical protein
MARGSTFRALADPTEDQGGLFTRRHAEATGMAWSTLARLTHDGVAERVAHGVYRLAGSAADHRPCPRPARSTIPLPGRCRPRGPAPRPGNGGGADGVDRGSEQAGYAAEAKRASNFPVWTLPGASPW